MASSGKKNKKKWKPVAPTEVIQYSGIGVQRKTVAWSEEAELEQNDYDYGRKMDNITLPTAPRAARAEDDDAKIPQEPPFVAYLTNVPYEVNEDELINYFQDLKVNVKVKTVTLPREERTNKLKGYGYVEFEDRASFVNAMAEASDMTIKGRRVRIDVSSGHGDARGGRGNRSGGGIEPDYINRDWRAGGPPPDRDDDGYRAGRRDYGGDRGGYGKRDERRSGYGDRDRDRGYRDRGYGRDDNKEWSRDGDRDRGGGGGGGSGSWRDDKDRGYGRSNYDDRRNDLGSWRNRDDREDRDRERRSPERSEPKSRPKITLKPRTIPLEEDKKEPDTSAASIFGGAKPVNTAAREREIEERLARQSAVVEDNSRRRGPSSQDSWDRDRDSTRNKDRESDRDHDKDRGRDDDYRGKDVQEGDIDRKSENDNRDLETERVSSRDKESRVEDNPRKLEPAPPPKENVWLSRQQQNSSNTVNNGRTSPSEAENQPKSRGSSPRPPPRDNSSGEGHVQKYQPPRRSSSEQKRGDRKPSHDERGKGSSVSGSGRGGSAGGGPVKPSSQGPTRSKETKKDDRDEKLRTPKFEEQKAPNFAGSNKFAYLEEANETAAN